MSTSAAEVISPALVCTGRSSSTFTALACRPLMVSLVSAIMNSSLAYDVTFTARKPHRPTWAPRERRELERRVITQLAQHRGKHHCYPASPIPVHRLAPA